MERIRTPLLEIACEISGPADGVPVILLHGWPYDPRTLRRHASAARGGWLSNHRALSARLRRNALSLLHHAALGSAGSARPRSHRAHGCACALARRAGRLRLGRARRLHCRGAVAGARALPRYRQRLQHPGHRALRRAGIARAGASLLVPVLFSHRARARRPCRQPARVLPADLAAVVAKLGVR